MSSLGSFTSGDELVIFVDLADPYSHLALPGTFALLEQTQQSARWLPFTRPAIEKPPAQRDDENRSERHRRLRKEYQDRELRFYADALELPLASLYQPVDTAPFAHALLWLSQPGTVAKGAAMFVHLGFEWHWSNREDLSDCRVVAKLLDECGAAGLQWQALASQNGKLKLAAQAHWQLHLEQAREAGLFNAPAYVHQEQVFYGRAHLPLLQQRLCPA